MEGEVVARCKGARESRSPDVYDLSQNNGFVSVWIDSHISQLSIASTRLWWLVGLP